MQHALSMRGSRVARSSARGFSVVEALVAAAVLGIALVGMVQLHSSSIRGTARAERLGRASEVARQFAELLATTTPADLPACPPGPLAAPLVGATGCKGDVGQTFLFTPTKGVGCTFWVQDGPSVPSIDDPNAAAGAIVAQPNAGPTGPQPSQFRIDVSVSAHPSANRFPDAALLTVWVCWRDEIGRVNEVRTRRILY